MRLGLADGPEVFGRGCAVGAAEKSAGAGMQPKLITPSIPLVEAWLRTDIDLKATVIHERLVTEDGLYRQLSAGQDVCGRGPAADLWPRKARMSHTRQRPNSRRH